ncbi:MAG: ATP-dependent RecD-like DNA helicase, partial [Rhodothermaceae bacterium]
METITGVIEKYIFHNENNGYSVVLLEDGTTVVGTLPSIKEEETLELTGTWIYHEKYGEQFKVEDFKVLYPQTTPSIIKYLSSGFIPGVGKSLATRIVKKFGTQTFDIFNESPERLKEVEGIGEKKYKKIIDSWENQKGVVDIMIFLQNYGISQNKAIKIHKVYGNQTVQMFKENPYQLAKDIWGIGFKSVDKIGIELGFDLNDPLRVSAAIEFLLENSANQGNVFLPEEILIQKCLYDLEIDLRNNYFILDLMIDKGRIIREDENIYLDTLYYAEKYIEEKISLLATTENDLYNKGIKKLKKIKDDFSEEQLEAIEMSLKQRLLILTGGPGTGKTTTLKGIIDLYNQLDKKIMLAAPTGRAAKRMTEVTGIEAKTIHRLLEYNPSDQMFYIDESNPLETDVLIVDETSMLDTLLMQNLLRPIKEDTTLILVGDSNQLPSIGPGNILHDLIESKSIAVVELSKIFRQAEESRIVTVAHEINRGEYPGLAIKRDSDFFFIEENDSSKIPDLIYDLISERLPDKYKLDPFNDIQILSPMYKGMAGVNNINEVLQERLNHEEVVLTQGNKHYKYFDKLMQLKNNYDKEVFNGDIGFVSRYSKESQKLSISFSGKDVEYDQGELDEITLAYATTVHKSQGSEYPCIILPIIPEHQIMHQRNLIYTAITRASKLMIVIGNKNSFYNAIGNNKIQQRYTS